MSIDLLPCPFCGKEPRTRQLGNRVFGEIICDHCDITLMASAVGGDVMKAWNTRHEAAKEAGQPVERSKRILFSADKSSREAFEQHLYEQDSLSLSREEKLVIDCFIDFLSENAPKRESVADALKHAQEVTKPLRDAEREGENITAETMNFRMGDKA